jgi:hypothetical protein
LPEECESNTLYLRPEVGKKPWSNIWSKYTPWDNRVQLCPKHVAALKAGTDIKLLNAIILYVDKHRSDSDNNNIVTIVPEVLDEKWFQDACPHPASSSSS